ncbi:hypothetical protein PoB_003550600 [Plakobranchus ocellatus]|uniref:Uncharacterized protein n=1 Tax=Plakobranchus ocellatus TaxID=259542 RepID=A0AAV4AR02_9GAST|nr:hypothetical protein PoB_003550600 [Plakobranchus ocellatus]
MAVDIDGTHDHSCYTDCTDDEYQAWAQVPNLVGPGDETKADWMAVDIDGTHDHSCHTDCTDDEYQAWALVISSFQALCQARAQRSGLEVTAEKSLCISGGFAIHCTIDNPIGFYDQDVHSMRQTG